MATLEPEERCPGNPIVGAGYPYCHGKQPQFLKYKTVCETVCVCGPNGTRTCEIKATRGHY